MRGALDIHGTRTMNMIIRGKRFYGRILAVATACVLMMIPLATGTAQQATMELPRVQSWKTTNGIRVVYLEDRLPQLTIVATIGFGTLYENERNAGIADLLARTLSLAGSKRYPGTAMYEAIESVGGTIGVSSSWEGITVTVRVLERHAARAFDVLGDLVTNPNWDARKLEDARALLIETIKRKQDRPFELGYEALREIVFAGKGYGAIAREKTVRACTLDDLTSVWRTYAVAGNTLLGVSTSIPAPAVRRHAEVLQGLPAGDAADYAIDAAAVRASIATSAGVIYLVPKDIPQATILIGTVAPDIASPNTSALRVMNYILGEGSFNSRLMEEVRVKRGLAYSVQSVIGFRRNAGIFFAMAQTNADQATVTLEVMRENIARMSREPVSGEELVWARESIANSFVFEFDTSLAVVQKYLYLRYNRLPDSYLIDYIPRIRAITATRIQEEARSLFGGGTVTVVVGRRDMAPALGKFGRVVVLGDR